MTNVKEVNKHGLKNKSNNRLIEKKDKKQYIKKSIYSVYVLLVKNHLLLYFGDKEK